MDHRGPRLDLTPLKGVVLGSLLFFGSAPAVEIARGYLTDVHAEGFVAVWTLSNAAKPELHIYADEAGAVEVTDKLDVTLYAVKGDEGAIQGDLDVQARAKALQASMALRQVVVARVEDAKPGQTYWYRMTANDGEKPASYPGDKAGSVRLPPPSAVVPAPVKVTLALGEELPGSVVMVEIPGTLHPVSGIVGDGVPLDQVMLDLATLRLADGRPWVFGEPSMLNLTWFRDGNATEAFGGTLHPLMAGHVVQVEALVWEGLEPEAPTPPPEDTDPDTDPADTDTDAHTDLEQDTDTGGPVDTDTGDSSDTGESGDIVDTDAADTDASDSDPADTDVEDTDDTDVEEEPEPFSLQIEGTCPGFIAIEARGATPQGAVVLLSDKMEGMNPLPPGTCGGSFTELGEGMQLRAVVTAHEDGRIRLAPRVFLADACDQIFQAYDATTCALSAAISLEKEEPEPDPPAPVLDPSDDAR